MPKVGIELSTKSYEDFISNDFTTNATDWPDDVAINRNIYCGSFPSSSASSKKPVSVNIEPRKQRNFHTSASACIHSVFR